MTERPKRYKIGVHHIWPQCVNGVQEVVLASDCEKLEAENRELRDRVQKAEKEDEQLWSRLTEAERVIQNLVDGFGGVAEEEDLREARAFLNQKEDTHE